MFFYVNATISLFGMHNEDEAVGSLNFLFPYGPYATCKLWLGPGARSHNGGHTWREFYEECNRILNGVFVSMQ